MTSTEKLLKYCKTHFIDNNLQVICERMLSDQRFPVAPGATKSHHAYTGGLAVHTLEVVNYCLRMLEGCQDHDTPRYRTDVVLAAAITHDWGKILDYTQDNEDKWQNAPHKYLIHHIAASHAEFMCQARGVGLRKETQEAVQHCILSHHGRKEWGSPVEPQTPEALLLHQADIWSAKFGPGKDFAIINV